MANFLHYLSPTLIFLAITVFLLLWFFVSYWNGTALLRPKKGTAQWVTARGLVDPPRFHVSFPTKRHPMERRDTLPLLLITVIYAVTAFWNLGATTNPQTYHDFSVVDTVTCQLEGGLELGSIRYYPNLGTGSYKVAVSSDGVNWQILSTATDEDGSTYYYWSDTSVEGSNTMPQGYTTLFNWEEIVPVEPITVEYLRIIGTPDKDVLRLGELVLYDTAGNAVYPTGFYPADTDLSTDLIGTALFDEWDTVPTDLSWYNSTYFDEIYHARTAMEHIEGVYPYEISHPPLGKLIIGLGIQLFGMTPFGWRFTGTLAGVLMLPNLYVFLKNLFGKTKVATCGTILLAADFMHLAQTRIATIDSYGVLFILLMYFFLYRWLTLPAGSSFSKGILPLFLSGLCWGVGAACKWTVIYGAIGLALLYFVGMYFKLRDWGNGNDSAEGHRAIPTSPASWMVRTLLFSVLTFVVIPAVIYTLSYLPYAIAKGDTSVGALVSTMWDNQVYMLTYHNGVMDTHPYSSRWYQWLFNIRPILYYLDWQSVPGMKSAFGAFLNPVVCWGGLLAMITMAVRLVRRHCGVALFILVGYLSQLLPWMLIERTTFAYHYFPSMIFLVMALAYVYNEVLESQLVHRTKMVYAMTGGAVVLYALFYPVLTGVMVPTWYGTNLLQWLSSWPF